MVQDLSREHHDPGDEDPNARSTPTQIIQLNLVVGFAGGGVTVYNKNNTTLLNWSALFEALVEHLERYGRNRGSISGTWEMVINRKGITFHTTPKDLRTEDLIWFMQAVLATLD